jgi:NadR type nicotinamide-nucleotide adenylyltransferase
MQASINSTSSIKKVAVIGPECTGKTDLSTFLAAHFKTDWVQEYARAYLDNLHRPYEQSDLLKIAHGQIRLEDEWYQSANRVLICDTNLIVVKVWSEDKFGTCDAEILKEMERRHYDLYLLTDIDVPWEEDPLREHPGRREHFRDIYRQEAVASHVPTVSISGPREERRKKAIAAVENILV